jgi:hypothetical protein
LNCGGAIFVQSILIFIQAGQYTAVPQFDALAVFTCIGFALSPDIFQGSHYGIQPEARSIDCVYAIRRQFVFMGFCACDKAAAAGLHLTAVRLYLFGTAF